MRGLFLYSLLLSLGLVACRDKGGAADSGAGADDADGDGYLALDAGGDDCDDGDAYVHPAASEVCDGVDNDCDGSPDEDVKTTFYADGDGDGYGDAGVAAQSCLPPDGYVPNSGDCDDAAAAVHPRAEEHCDGIDEDCDGTADDDVSAGLYADADGDGYGDPGAALAGCGPVAGYVADNSDCDDADPAASPAGTEVCDGADNDCDGGADEGLTDTYYRDADGDGYGDEAAEACAPVDGYAGQGGDCDDASAAASPGAEEICDDLDNDCDGEADEQSASDAGTWYYDGDGDGYGDSSVTLVACEPGGDFVAAGGDCADAEAEIHPGADELCDGEDDDCDAQIDESSALDAGTFYADADADGYGDPGAPLAACEQPAGYLADDSDCDDADAGAFPGADEVCDDADDDCDGDIDEEVVDPPDWYRDGDEDGYGDPSEALAVCEQPAGYVDNAEDCDDADATDTDGDGEQDCADADIDGDGLRNEWDADERDAAVARGPTGGLGGDGSVTLSGAVVAGEYAWLVGGAAAGASQLEVTDGSLFAAGDEVLVLSQQGADAGTWQAVFVASVSGDTLAIEPPLEDAYSSASAALVQRIPHYTALYVPASATLAADPWDSGGSGVVVARSQGEILVFGAVSADGAGFAGGAGVAGNAASPYQGESYLGLGAAGVNAANNGGGGVHVGYYADGGGGGGYGASGGYGKGSTGTNTTAGGATYGSSSLLLGYLGSGGGGGSPDPSGDGSNVKNVSGDGGAGGGLVLLFSASTITVSGSLSADGADGADGYSFTGKIGGGGGGSGGSIYLVAPALLLSGSVTAAGGLGGDSDYKGTSPYGSAVGGDGGSGRIRLDTDSWTGSTSPTPGTVGAYAD